MKLWKSTLQGRASLTARPPEAVHRFRRRAASSLFHAVFGHDCRYLAREAIAWHWKANLPMTNEVIDATSARAQEELAKARSKAIGAGVGGSP
jgi:hypothetical protein